MYNMLENKNYFDSMSTYYAVDSTVYFSFEKVNEVGLLLKVCKGRAVLTPEVEKEIFGYGYNLGSGFEYQSIFDSAKWCKIPKNNFYASTFNNVVRFSNESYGILSLYNYYKEFFYVANTNHYSTTSEINNCDWQCNLSSLNSQADKEISKWSLCNSKNVELFTNDRKIVDLLRSAGVFVLRSIGILIKAIKDGLISFLDAEEIYKKWSIIDPGSCIWKKINKVKYLVEFKDIYLNFNFSN